MTKNRSPKVLHRMAGALLVGVLGTPVALITSAGPVAAAECAHADLVPRRSTHSDFNMRVIADEVTRFRFEDAVECLVNAERARYGVRTLVEHKALQWTALTHSRDMVNRNFFAHTNPDGTTAAARVAASDYPYSYCGENIAWSYGPSTTPRQIVTSWMNSSGHRTNILNPRCAHEGVGVALGRPGNAYASPAATVTQVFGSY